MCVCVCVAFSVLNISRISCQNPPRVGFSVLVCLIDSPDHKKLDSCKQYLDFKRESHLLSYCLHLSGYV